MRNILYYEFSKKSKSMDDMIPIYYQGPFWSFWLINIFAKIANFGLHFRFKIEDRFTFPANKRKLLRGYGQKVHN